LIGVQTVASDILRCLSRIVKHLLARNYIEANNSYMMLAIGNAPWPVGATRTGMSIVALAPAIRMGRLQFVINNCRHSRSSESIKNV
jgi:pre-mRNA-splicing factor 18